MIFMLTRCTGSVWTEMCTYVEKAFKESQICRNSKNQKSSYKTQTILFQLIFNSIFIVFSFSSSSIPSRSIILDFFQFFTGWCLKMAPIICNIRGLSSFLDLGGQVVHNAVLYSAKIWVGNCPSCPPTLRAWILVNKKFRIRVILAIVDMTQV